MTSYHYTECGLENVFIEGMEQVLDHAGDDTIVIPAIGLLHKAISEGIVMLPCKMSGRELRFLRSEMGMTQEQLAGILKVTLLTVSRWERAETPITDTAEMLIRLLAVDHLALGVKLDVDSVSAKVTRAVRSTPIRIDGSKPKQYQLLAA